MTKFRNIKQMVQANYQVNLTWPYLKSWIDDQQVNMNPEFQRNYVWNETQKEQYIEWRLRGGFSGKDIYFNHPGWFSNWKGEMVIVDGKQRIEAVLSFMNNKFKAYGYYYNEYKDKLHIRCDFIAHVADLKNEKDILQWYIDMNTGGTIHTNDEIEKVLKLINK